VQKEHQEHGKYIKQHPEMDGQIEKLDLQSQIEQLEAKMEELKKLAKKEEN